MSQLYYYQLQTSGYYRNKILEWSTQITELSFRSNPIENGKNMKANLVLIFASTGAKPYKTS